MCGSVREKDLGSNSRLALASGKFLSESLRKTGRWGSGVVAPRYMEHCSLRKPERPVHFTRRMTE